MKKLLLTLSLVLGFTVAQAAVTTTYNLAPGELNTNLTTSPVAVRSVTVHVSGGAGNGAATDVTWYLYNAWKTNTSDKTLATGWTETQQRYGGYTNYTSYTTNYALMKTNYFGGTNTVYYSNILVTVTNLLAGATNTYDIVAQSTTASNLSTTVNFDPPYIAFRGLYLTNTPCFTNVSGVSYISITYDPLY